MGQQNSIDLLEGIHELKGFDFIVFTTFSFDPVFFENSLLRSIRQNNPAASILVLVDMDVYQDTLNLSTEATGRDYGLVPIPKSLFHPKLFLFLSEVRQVVFIGSHNLTLSGVAHNLEITCKTEEVTVVRNAIDYLRSVLRQYATQESYWLQKLDEYAVKVRSPAESGLALLHNLDRPMLDSLTEEIQRRNVKAERIYIAAPFFSNVKSLVEKLKLASNASSVHICVQANSHNLDPTTLRFPWLSFHEIVLQEHRFFHSKIIMFDSGKGGLLLVGSPNFTAAALAEPARPGNYELAILVPCNQDILCGLALKRIDAAQIKSSMRAPTTSRQSAPEKPVTVLNANLDPTSRLVLDVYSCKDLEATIIVQYTDGSADEIPVGIGDSSQHIETELVAKKAIDSVSIMRDGKAVSNAARVYLPSDRQRQIARLARTNPVELSSMVAGSRDISEFLQFVEVIFSGWTQDSRTPREPAARVYGPAPGRQTGFSSSEDLIDLVRQIIVTRKAREQPEGQALGSREQDQQASKMQVTHREREYRETVDRLLERISDAFLDRKITQDNSSGMYLLYLITCLKLLRLLGRGNEQYHLSRLFERLGGMIAAHHIHDTDAGQTRKLFTLLLYVYQNLQRNLEHETAFHKIVSSEIDRTLRESLLPGGDFLAGLSFSRLANTDLQGTLSGAAETVAGVSDIVAKATCDLAFSDDVTADAQLNHLLSSLELAMESPKRNEDVLYLSRLLAQALSLRPRFKGRTLAWAKQHLATSNQHPFARRVLEEDIVTACSAH